MQIRERIFNCSDMRLMHFILDKILKLLIITRLSTISRCKVISSQKQSVFWPTLYITTHWRPPGMQTLTSIRRRGWCGQIASLPLSFLIFFCFLCQAHRSNCASDKPVRAQNVSFCAKKCLLRSERCAPKSYGSTPHSQKNLNFGGVNRTFKHE